MRHAALLTSSFFGGADLRKQTGQRTAAAASRIDAARNDDTEQNRVQDCRHRRTGHGTIHPTRSCE